MQDIRVKVDSGSYLITQNLNDLKSFAKQKSKVLLICDSNTKQHALTIQNDLNCESLLEVLSPGEDTKSFTSIVYLLEKYSSQLNRASGVVLVGGGMIGDLGALFSSLLFRGIDFYMVPTTLLSMVDSSIGGKTAVNLKTGKNLAGVFSSPKGVFINFNFLKTLPWIELLSGYGELIKSALIDSEAFYQKALNLDLKGYFESKEVSDEFSTLVYKAMLLKKNVVQEDPFEKGLRKVLNLGHTMSHAIESYYKYKIPHGVCVFYGLFLEGALGKHLGYVDSNYPLEVLDKFRQLGLDEFDGKWRDLESWLKVDKKNFDATIQFAFLKKPGVLYDLQKISTSVQLEKVFEKEEIFS
ncbi:MAG: 3-dehydroquinate synthase [Candidatus Cloacimonetes bacterium]|nr:3-dehydroquinate synthase [Candidatus Cloacimonadota bacterium]